jgi:hypothetical protein
MSEAERVLDAMPSGEWLRTQWIARVAFGLGSTPGPHPHEYGATRRILRRLAASGRVDHATLKSSERATSAACPSGSRSPDRNGG